MSKAKKASEGSGGMLYLVGFIGAFLYYMQAATGFVTIITGILKSLVWPAIIVYKFLENFYGLV